MNHQLLNIQILELKLALVKLQVNKIEATQFQEYENLAALLDQESQLNQTLINHRDELVKKLSELEKESSTLDEEYLILNLLQEFTDVGWREKIHEIKTEFMERLKTEYKQLWNERKKLQQENQNDVVDLVHKQIVEIGNFIVKHAN